MGPETIMSSGYNVSTPAKSAARTGARQVIGGTAKRVEPGCFNRAQRDYVPAVSLNAKG
jgi:hypothetical protein